MKDSIPGTDGSWTSSPSPDGSQLVFSFLTYSGLNVFTLSTGTGITLPVNAYAPRWSPSGTAIAYLVITSGALGAINIIQADGTGNRVILSGGLFARGVDWSPDGQWLLAQNASTSQFDIINVNTGMALPLPFTNANTWGASWGPLPSLSATRVRDAGAYPISHAHSMAIGARPRGAHAGR